MSIGGITHNQRALLGHAEAGRTIRVLRQPGDDGAVLVLLNGEPISAYRRSTFNRLWGLFTRVGAVRDEANRAWADDFRLAEIGP